MLKVRREDGRETLMFNSKNQNEYTMGPFKLTKEGGLLRDGRPSLVFTEYQDSGSDEWKHIPRPIWVRRSSDKEKPANWLKLVQTVKNGPFTDGRRQSIRSQDIASGVWFQEADRNPAYQEYSLDLTTWSPFNILPDTISPAVANVLLLSETVPTTTTFTVAPSPPGWHSKAVVAAATALAVLEYPLVADYKSVSLITMANGLLYEYGGMPRYLHALTIPVAYYATQDDFNTAWVIMTGQLFGAVGLRHIRARRPLPQARELAGWQILDDDNGTLTLILSTVPTWLKDVFSTTAVMNGVACFRARVSTEEFMRYLDRAWSGLKWVGKQMMAWAPRLVTLVYQIVVGFFKGVLSVPLGGKLAVGLFIAYRLSGFDMAKATDMTRQLARDIFPQSKLQTSKEFLDQYKPMAEEKQKELLLDFKSELDAAVASREDVVLSQFNRHLNQIMVYEACQSRISGSGQVSFHAMETYTLIFHALGDALNLDDVTVVGNVGSFLQTFVSGMGYLGKGDELESFAARCEDVLLRNAPARTSTIKYIFAELPMHRRLGANILQVIEATNVQMEILLAQGAHTDLQTIAKNVQNVINHALRGDNAGSAFAVSSLPQEFQRGIKAIDEQWQGSTVAIATPQENAVALVGGQEVANKDTVVVRDQGRRKLVNLDVLYNNPVAEAVEDAAQKQLTGARTRLDEVIQDSRRNESNFVANAVLRQLELARAQTDLYAVVVGAATNNPISAVGAVSAVSKAIAYAVTSPLIIAGVVLSAGIVFELSADLFAMTPAQPAPNRTVTVNLAIAPRSFFEQINMSDADRAKYIEEYGPQFSFNATALELHYLGPMMHNLENATAVTVVPNGAPPAATREIAVVGMSVTPHQYFYTAWGHAYALLKVEIQVQGRDTAHLASFISENKDKKQIVTTYCLQYMRYPTEPICAVTQHWVWDRVKPFTLDVELDEAEVYTWLTTVVNMLQRGDSTMAEFAPILLSAVLQSWNTGSFKGGAEAPPARPIVQLSGGRSSGMVRFKF